MMPFVDHSPTSQNNSLSCELLAGVGVGPVAPLPASKPATDDILIMGSLSEIGTHEVGKWGDESFPRHSGSSLEHSPNNAHHHSGDRLEFASEGSRTHIDKEWYCRGEEELYMPLGNEESSLQPEKPNSSQSSGSSRRNRKSLEALTTVTSQVSYTKFRERFEVCGLYVSETSLLGSLNTPGQMLIVTTGSGGQWSWCRHDYTPI